MRARQKPLKWLTARNAVVALAVFALGVVVVSVGISRHRTHRASRFSQRLRDEDAAVALQTVEELRALGLLTDGFMRHVSLLDANLSGADLSGANLRGVAMPGADLSGADLSGANLERAYMHEVNLAGADLSGASLRGASLRQADLSGARGLTDTQLAHTRGLLAATMPDGARYDGRYRLLSDLVEYGEENDPDDAAAMATFYGVSLEDYQRGQQWAEQNLASMPRWRESDEGPPDQEVEPGAVGVLASAALSLLLVILLLPALPDTAPDRP